MKTHWHDLNPWKDKILYIPVELAASLCEYSWSDEETLTHWRQYGDKLDAYILPQPSGLHCLGVRYGADGPEYVSPHANQKALTGVLELFKDLTGVDPRYLENVAYLNTRD